jgi:phytoene dehydrogenase-like protein
MAGMSRYDTPIPGLFLCGAGTHPCGGVTGINGRIAAEAVLASTPVTA